MMQEIKLSKIRRLNLFEARQKKNIYITCQYLVNLEPYIQF